MFHDLLELAWGPPPRGRSNTNLGKPYQWYGLWMTIKGLTSTRSQPLARVWGGHWYHVQLGWPIPIYQHFALLLLMFINTTTKEYENICLLWLLYKWMNQFFIFAIWGLTQGTLHEWTLKNQPICKVDLIAHNNVQCTLICANRSSHADILTFHTILSS